MYSTLGKTYVFLVTIEAIVTLSTVAFTLLDYERTSENSRFMSVFAAYLCVFFTYFAWDSVLQEKIFQFFASVGMHLCVTSFIVWSFFADSISADPITSKLVFGYACLMQAIYLIMAPFMFDTFGWHLYKRVGACIVLQSMYRDVQVAFTLQKVDIMLNGMLVLLATAKLWTDYMDIECILNLVALVLSVIWGQLGRYAIRHESVPAFKVWLISSFIAPVFVVYKLVQFNFSSYYSQYPLERYLQFYIFGSLFLLIRVGLIYSAWRTYRNFNRGLKERVFRSVANSKLKLIEGQTDGSNGSSFPSSNLGGANGINADHTISIASSATESYTSPLLSLGGISSTLQGSELGSLAIGSSMNMDVGRGPVQVLQSSSSNLSQDGKFSEAPGSVSLTMLPSKSTKSSSPIHQQTNLSLPGVRAGTSGDTSSNINQMGSYNTSGSYGVVAGTSSMSMKTSTSQGQQGQVNDNMPASVPGSLHAGSSFSSDFHGSLSTPGSMSLNTAGKSVMRKQLAAKKPNISSILGTSTSGIDTTAETTQNVSPSMSQSQSQSQSQSRNGTGDTMATPVVLTPTSTSERIWTQKISRSTSGTGLGAGAGAGSTAPTTMMQDGSTFTFDGENDGGGQPTRLRSRSRTRSRDPSVTRSRSGSEIRDQYQSQTRTRSRTSSQSRFEKEIQYSRTPWEL